MIIFGGIAAVAGVVLLHVALGMTLRANATTRVPFYRNADIVPTGSVAVRAAGAGLLVFGIVFLSAAAWYWPFVIVAAGPVAGLIAIMIHNRRIRGATPL